MTDNKLHQLPDNAIRSLTTLEAELETYAVNTTHIPRVTKAKVMELVTQKAEEIKTKAGQVTGFPMKVKIVVRTPDYVIASLYPADEPPPETVRLRPEYDYTKHAI